jgi:hypothetical protein
MSRRIDIELTSSRPDGTWTWRAPGAREPRGVMAGSLLPAGALVGDVLRAEVESDIDGMTVTQVIGGAKSRKEPDRIEIIGSGRPFEPVMQTLSAKSDRPRRDGDDRPRRDRADRPDRGDRRDRPARPPGGPGSTGSPGRDGRDRPARPPRPEGAGGSRDTATDRRDRAARPPRPQVPELPQRPKAKRLKPARTHRNALLASLPDEHRVVAEQVMRGGIPAVRQAVQDQNTQLREAGQSEIRSGGVLALAEELLPTVRVAEWLDRAEAAIADLDELDLRDLRSVVAASGDPVVARDESTRDLTAQLRDGLNRRQDAEHEQWLGDMTAALDIGRLVRALRLSSRPPKAGVRFPTELGARLTEATVGALTPDASSERWAAVVEALAYSPIRSMVTVAAPPTSITDELISAINRVAGLLPAIATLLGVTPPPPGSRSPSSRPQRPTRPGAERRPPGKPGGSAPIPPPPPAPALVLPAAASTATDEPAAVPDVTEQAPSTAEPTGAATDDNEPTVVSTHEPVSTDTIAADGTPPLAAASAAPIATVADTRPEVAVAESDAPAAVETASIEPTTAETAAVETATIETATVESAAVEPTAVESDSNADGSIESHPASS